MKLSRYVVYLPLVLCLIDQHQGVSQAQFNIKAGVESWSSKDETGLPEGSHHSGQTIGYKVLDLKAVDISGLTGGETFFYYDLESNDIGLDNDQLHGVFLTATGAVHIAFFSFLTTEIRYRYAFHPIIKERPESKLRGWSIEAGIKF